VSFSNELGNVKFFKEGMLIKPWFYPNKLLIDVPFNNNVSRPDWSIKQDWVTPDTVCVGIEDIWTLSVKSSTFSVPDDGN